MNFDAAIADAVRAELAPLLAELHRLQTPLAPVAVNVKEAARMLSVDETIVRRMIRENALPAVVLPTMTEKRVPVWALRQLVGDPTVTVPELAEAS